MFRSALFVAVGVVCSASPSWSSLLEYKCARDGGKVIRPLICPQNKAVINGPFCVKRDAQTRALVFYNGCTGVKGDYARIFFDACRLHDHCYHHEPVTSGKSRLDCDREFFRHMKTTCRRRAKSFPALQKCRGVALTFYKVVRRRGAPSWGCANSLADYPSTL